LVLGGEIIINLALHYKYRDEISWLRRRRRSITRRKKKKPKRRSNQRNTGTNGRECQKSSFFISESFIG
jgi:hypothetical protein